jgi:hypothetical protein
MSWGHYDTATIRVTQARKGAQSFLVGVCQRYQSWG